MLCVSSGPLSLYIKLACIHRGSKWSWVVGVMSGMLCVNSGPLSLYIKLACINRGSDWSWVVGVMSGMLWLTSFPVTTMCFCLYTSICRLVKHNGLTHPKFN